MITLLQNTNYWRHLHVLLVCYVILYWKHNNKKNSWIKNSFSKSINANWQLKNITLLISFKIAELSISQDNQKIQFYQQVLSKHWNKIVFLLLKSVLIEISLIEMSTSLSVGSSTRIVQLYGSNILLFARIRVESFLNFSVTFTIS